MAIVPEVVILERGTKIAQIVGEKDFERLEPTLNLTNSRYGLRETDLGIPFRHGDRTFVLFGDTIGVHPGDAIAFTTDTTPEDGLELTFLTADDGTYLAITIPGISQRAFEVPTEGTSFGGNMYVYHTTDSLRDAHMGRTVLAVSRDNGQTFEYLYDVSIHNFIQLAVVEVDSAEWEGLPQTAGSGIVIFGAGEYRRTSVRLAYQPAERIEDRDSLRYFTGINNAGQPAWSDDEKDARELFDHPCVGEMSVTYNRFIRRWIMLYNCAIEPNGITVRVADQPWGPWSTPQVLFNPQDDEGYCNFIHRSWNVENCDTLAREGTEYDNGGAYGPYQFEDLAIGDESQTTIYFTMSTWRPYTVVLMKATLGR
jgi:hypothetical protein